MFHKHDHPAENGESKGRVTKALNKLGLEKLSHTLHLDFHHSESAKSSSVDGPPSDIDSVSRNS